MKIKTGINLILIIEICALCGMFSADAAFSQASFDSLKIYFNRDFPDSFYSELLNAYEQIWISQTADRPTRKRKNIWRLIPSDMSQAATPITSAKTFDCTMPRWSENQKLIVYVSTQTGLKNLWLMKIDGSDNRQLTSGTANDEYPVWSPQKAIVAFVRNGALYWIATDTVKETKLTEEDIQVTQVCAWSRDNQRILIRVYGANNKQQLAEYLVESQKIVYLNQPYHASLMFTDIRIHPKENLILIEKFDYGVYDIFLKTGNGNNTMLPLTEAFSCDRFPDWADEGKYLIYSSTRGLTD